MAKIVYKPRLKKSFFQKELSAFLCKNLLKLKKIKWRFLIKQNTFFQNFVRNDVIIFENGVSDIRKEYSKGLKINQKFFSIFGCLKKAYLLKTLSASFKKMSFKHGQKVTFFKHLKYRLDVTLFNVNFTKTLFQSRWCIKNGFVFVNQRIVKSPTFMLQSGDLIEFKFCSNLQEIIFSEKTFNLTEQEFEVCYDTFVFVVLSKDNEILLNSKVFFNLDELTHFNKSLLNY